MTVVPEFGADACPGGLPRGKESAAVADDLQQLPETERLRTGAITALSTMEQVVVSLPQTGFESGTELLPILRSVVALAKKSEALERAPVPELMRLEAALEQLAPSGEWASSNYAALPEQTRLVIVQLRDIFERDENVRTASSGSTSSCSGREGVPRP